MSTPPSAFTLERVISEAQQAIARMLHEDGQIFENDETGLIEALNAENINVEGVLRKLVRGALDAKANAAAAKSRMDDLKARQARFEHQEEKYREAVLNVMQALGLKSFRDPEFSLSISPGKPKVIITDESKLSDDLVTVTVTRTPNKAAILKALLGGGDYAECEFSEVVNGAELANASSVLTVRTK
jgi:Siphovirus Gp157